MDKTKREQSAGGEHLSGTADPLSTDEEASQACDDDQKTALGQIALDVRYR